MTTQPTLAFTVPTNPTNEFMVDIETGGTEAGSAILEIAAAEFNPKTGEILREWSNQVDLLDCIRLGLTFDPGTAEFHLSKKYDGTLRGAPLQRVLNALDVFLHLGSDDITVWAWGFDFETNLLKPACKAAGFPLPWKYWQAMDARTAWNLAFPGVKHPPRPHRAAEDVRLQIADLSKAYANLHRVS
jgi:exodeoxyribonuclease VIII